MKKAYNMAKTMNIPILSLVENYSYLKCPDCGKEIRVFGESHIEEIAEELNLAVGGKMPIDPVLAAAADAGRFADMINPYVEEAVEILRKL